MASSEVVSELDEMDAASNQDIDEKEAKPATASPVTTSNIMRQNRSINTVRRQRLISTSLTKTPIVDGEFEDYHQHRLKEEVDEFDPKYRLYAVVVSISKVKKPKLRYQDTFLFYSHSFSSPTLAC